jgi:uncharacterized protein involved in exopolysaccharide biosynthesis
VIALIVEVAARHFFRIVLLSLLCATMAAWFLLNRPDVYEARTLLLYKLGREYAYVPDPSDSGAKSPDPGDLQFAVNAEMQILNNPELLYDVLNVIGPERLYPDTIGRVDGEGLAAERLGEAVSITAVPGSYVVQIRARHADPDLSAEVADELVKVYLQKRRTIFRGQETRLLRDQLTAAQVQADQLSRAVSSFLAGKKLYSYENELTILTSQQARLREQHSQAKAARAGLAARETRLLAESASLDPTVADQEEFQRNPAKTDIEEQLRKLASERRAAIRTVSEGSPAVRSFDEEIAALGAELERQPERVFVRERVMSNPAYQNIEASLTEARVAIEEQDARMGEIQSQIDAGDARLREFAQVTDQLSLMRQQLAHQQQQVALLDGRLREAEILDSLDRDGQTNVRIIEPALAPYAPVGLPKKLILVIALAFGGIVGLGAAALTYLMRPTLISGRVAAYRLGVPILAEIPDLPGGLISTRTG